MPHFIVEYAETGSGADRETHRAAHIAYRQSFGSRMPLAGPLLGEAGQTIGSLVIIEADGQAAAQAVATADPFVAAGLLSLVSVRPYRIAALKPLA
jgi:uncharacterized protein YciI